MNFNSADQVDQICYQIRLADYPRGQNRARINNLFNGFPPFNEAEARENGINVNVNFLEGTVLSHDARAQFYGAFLRPERFFTASTDMGRKTKRQSYGQIVTTEMNKIMKRSMTYFETFRSKFAMDVLHGIGPAGWRDADKWCPDAIGIEDVGIPASTLLTMENLPFFYQYRSYTAPELIALTKDRESAERAGWNLALVDRCIEWIDRDTMALMGSNWPEVWSPEKTQERVKGDGGFYAGDQVPTIDTFDFYYLSDEDGELGWRRRVILDAWSTPRGSGNVAIASRDKGKEWAVGQFLFNPGSRKYADHISQLISFQFADLSAVGPFRYHSVRSLGFLVYAVCHLQNRIRCRFNESVFESLMNYYRIRSSDDVERALKVDLINRGFIDETIQFVPQGERWQVNANLIELGLQNNQSIINSNSSSYTQQPQSTGGRERKTKFQVMAEINQTTALVQSAFNQAYQYQEAEYREIMRRFFKENSTDADVRKFRANCSRQGVPLDILQPDYWDIAPTRVMGAGNKTMEMAIAEQLLQMRNLFDPEPQREILREVTFNITGDAERAARWVPEEPLKISDSVHDAQLSMGVLMQGLPVAPKTGQNHKEYITVMLAELTALVDKYNKQGGMAPQDKIEGFQMVAQNLVQHIQLLAQDPEEKAAVADAGKQLAKIMNFVKAFAQRLQEQMKKQAQQQSPDPKTQSAVIMAKTKAKIAADVHAQRTAQKDIAFQREQRRKDAETQAEIQREMSKSKMKSIGE
jgi:hypothetical protein